MKMIRFLVATLLLFVVSSLAADNDTARSLRHSAAKDGAEAGSSFGQEYGVAIGIVVGVGVFLLGIACRACNK